MPVSRKGSVKTCNEAKISKLINDHKAVTVGIKPENLEINKKVNVWVIVRTVEQLRYWISDGNRS